MVKGARAGGFSMTFLEKHGETIIASLHLTVLLLADCNQICVSTNLCFSLGKFSIQADYRGITWMLSPPERDIEIIQGGGKKQ